MFHSVFLKRREKPNENLISECLFNRGQTFLLACLPTATLAIVYPVNSYKNLNRLIMLFFTFWFSASWVIGFFYKTEQNFYFPFYSWRLFDQVFYSYTDHGVLLLEVDGKRLNPPQDYVRSMVQYNQRRKKFSQANRTIIRMGKALSGQGFSDFTEVRLAFEKNFLGSFQSVKYKIVRRTWDPVKEWKNRKTGYPVTNVDLGTFEFVNDRYNSGATQQ